jgi:uncharacterized membrane protein
MRKWILIVPLAMVFFLLAISQQGEDQLLHVSRFEWAILMVGAITLTIFVAVALGVHQGGMSYEGASDQAREARLRALGLAKERYDKGEISAEQYEKVRRDLGDLPP